MLSYFEIASAAAIFRNSLGLGTQVLNLSSAMGIAALAHWQEQP